MRQTKKAFLDALEKSLGIVTHACKEVGIDRATYYRYYQKDQKFKQAVDNIGEMSIDFAESQLLKQIKEGNPTSTIFYLKTKGKKRGYVERIETEITAPFSELMKRVSERKNNNEPTKGD